MEQKIGYVLLDENNNIIQNWIQDNIPPFIILPNGDHLHAPSIGNYSNYKFVEKWRIDNPIIDTIQDGQNEEFDGTKYNIILNYRNPTKDELLNHSASVRYIKETSGISVSNNMIYTDRQSQSMINGIVTMLSLNPTMTLNYKTNSGFIQANSQIMTSIGTYVAQHVQTCFTTESTIVDSINSGTVTKYSEIDTIYDNINIIF